MHKASMNILVQVLRQTYASFLSDDYLEVEWLGHMVVVCLTCTEKGKRE